MKEILWDGSFDISDEHRDFDSVCTHGGVQRLTQVFTTNFDQLLDKTFGGRGAAITEKNFSDHKKVSAAGQIPIFYLRGRLDEEFEITESDIFGKKFPSLKTAFESALLNAERFVFVGYSMSDPDFRKIYMDYREKIAQRDKDGKVTYFVMPPSDAFAYRLGRLIWKERGALWIPLDARAFFRFLKYYLECRETMDIREQIMRKYSLKTDSEYEDHVARTAEILGVEKPEAVGFLSQVSSRIGVG